MPFRFGIPRLGLFDGRLDLKEHVLQYHNSMVPLEIPENKSEALMCKMFANSLKRVALTWYYRLKLGFIDCFEELSKKL